MTLIIGLTLGYLLGGYFMRRRMFDGLSESETLAAYHALGIRIARHNWAARHRREARG